LDSDEEDAYDYHWRGHDDPVPVMTVSIVPHHSPSPGGGEDFLSFEKVGDSRISDRPTIAYTHCGKVKFPPYSGIHCEMLPFRMGIRSSLPNPFWQYHDAVLQNCPVHQTELGRICYLNIWEEPAPTTATRPKRRLETVQGSNHDITDNSTFVAAWEHFYGMQRPLSPDILQGGVFVACSQDWTIYNARTTTTSSSEDLVRPFLPSPQRIRKHELIWMTCTTLYEIAVDGTDREDGTLSWIQLITSRCAPTPEELGIPSP